MLHLRELLQTQYETVKNNPSKALAKNERIEGYLEAGLISGMVTRNELKQVINDAHKAVYGVTFDERKEASLDAENLWDVPTWVRRGSDLKLEQGSSDDKTYLPINSIHELYKATLNSEQFAEELFNSENHGVTYTRLDNFCDRMNEVLMYLTILDAKARNEDVEKALERNGYENKIRLYRLSQ